MLSAIIVAGGSSRRMGFDKTFASLRGQPVIAHSLAAFAAVDGVTEIIVVGRAGRLAEIEQLVRERNCPKISAVIPGGLRRQDSVRNGLGQAREAFVAVHDAARPLVRPELIARVFESAQRHGGAAPAAPVSDTLKRVNRENIVIAGIERASLFAVQTPQIFRRDLLGKAYQQVFASGLEITDEISALEQLGGKVVLVPNEEPNFKITYPADLALAECALQSRP